MSVKHGDLKIYKCIANKAKNIITFRILLIYAYTFTAVQLSYSFTDVHLLCIFRTVHQDLYYKSSCVYSLYIVTNSQQQHYPSVKQADFEYFAWLLWNIKTLQNTEEKKISQNKTLQNEEINVYRRELPKKLVNVATNNKKIIRSKGSIRGEILKWSIN